MWHSRFSGSSLSRQVGLWKLAVVMRHRKRRERWATWLLAGLVAVLLLVNYSLTYPAALRYLSRTPYSGLLDLIVPAEWIYDETPLHGLINRAGEFWGTAAQLERDSQWRLRNSWWGANPRLNALLCVVAVAAVASGGVFGVRKTLDRFRTKTRNRPEHQIG
jgi:hypothetical protein